MSDSTSATQSFLDSLRGVVAPAPDTTYGSVLPIARNDLTGELRPAMPSALRDQASGLVDLLAGTQTGQVTPQATMSLLGGLVPEAAVPAVADAATPRVFAGLGSATADRMGLKTAQKMEANSLGTPDNIWQQTGWYRDKDNMWKSEIPDTSAQFTPAAPVRPNDFISGSLDRYIPTKTQRLGDVLDHPDLFAAYPALADIPVRPVPLNSALNGLKGAVYSDGSIGVAGGKPDEVLSTLLHEVQHKIQDIEGFAQGDTTSNYLPEGFAARADKAKSDWDMYRKQVNEVRSRPDPGTVQYAIEKQTNGQPLFDYQQKALDGVDADAPGLLDKFRSALTEKKAVQNISSTAYKQYSQTAGEVEARNVQERLAQGDTSTIPYKTEGYPIGPQIFNYGNGNRVTVSQVEHDPFAATAVDHDPFAMTPIDHDPFGAQP